MATTAVKSPSRRTTPFLQTRLSTVVLGVAGVLAFLAIWEIASRAGLVNARYLPPPSIVSVELIVQFGTAEFWIALGDTMRSWFIGLATSTIGAVVVGFAIGLSPFLRKFTASTIEFLRPIPSVGLIPLALLVFGIKPEASTFLIIYACFWAVLIQVLGGVVDIDPVADDTARTYGMNRRQRIRWVVWPTTLPYLMTGVRLAGTIALVIAITAELIVGTPGLGDLLATYQSAGRVPPVYAIALAAGLLGLAINGLLRLLESRILAWHTSVRGEVIV